MQRAGTRHPAIGVKLICQRPTLVWWLYLSLGIPAIVCLGAAVAISVILTPMFNSARVSLLIAYLYHFQMMNPIWPDAQPWDSFIFTFMSHLFC
jgi:hypothetical protein